MNGAIEQSPLLNELEVVLTEHECLYRTDHQYEHDPSQPLVVCMTGPSGSGKDSVMDSLVGEGLLKHMRTATSRNRRFNVSLGHSEEVNRRVADCHTVDQYLDLVDQLAEVGMIFDVEPRDKYVWMRWRRDNESEGDYYNDLCDEYGLIEFDIHYDNLYGLPMESLEAAAPTESSEVATDRAVPVIRNDIHGVESIYEILGNRFNVLSIAFIPDTWERIEDAIREREGNTASDADIARRVREDRESLAKFGLVNYIIQNTWSDVDGVPGLQYSINLVRMIVGEAVGEV